MSCGIKITLVFIRQRLVYARPRVLLEAPVTVWRGRHQSAKRDLKRSRENVQGSDLQRCVLTLPCWVGERDASEDRWEDKWLTNETARLTYTNRVFFSLFFPFLPEHFSQKLLTKSRQNFKHASFYVQSWGFYHSGSVFVLLFHVQRVFQFALCAWQAFHPTGEVHQHPPPG